MVYWNVFYDCYYVVIYQDADISNRKSVSPGESVELHQEKGNMTQIRVD